MRKRGKKLLAMMLAMSMTMNVVSMQAFADEPVVQENTIVNEDGTTTEQKITTTTTTDSTTGKTTVVVEIHEDTTGTNEEGEVVDAEETSIETTVTDENGKIVESSKVEDGKEITVQENVPDVEAPDTTVSLVPGKETSKTETEENTETTGDKPNGTDDKEYDYTKTTTESNRTVTAETSDIKVSFDETESELTAVKPDTKVDAEGDIIQGYYSDGTKKEGIAERENYFHRFGLYYKVDSETGEIERNPETGEIEWYKKHSHTNAEIPATWNEEADYQYSGWGDYPEDYRVNYVKYYKDAATGEIKENTDWAEPIMLALEDKNGNIVYAYCVDLETNAEYGAWYEVANLEDNDYYASKESEEHIRAIVKNGYWGTSNTPDAEGNFGIGSLAGMKKNLADAFANNALEDKDITITIDGDVKTVKLSELMKGLTEAEAANVTQAAIWTYANGSVAAQGGEPGEVVVGEGGFWIDYGKNSEEAKIRMDTLYTYLIGLTEKEQTETVIIDKEAFLDEESLSLTVGDKVGEKTTTDADGQEVVNGIYETALNFKLAFTPDPNSDDLLVHVSYKDLDGKDVVVTKRLAGKNSDGQTYDTISADDNGNYTLEGLKLSENEDFNFDLRLEGTQFLKEGVYVYSPQGGRKASQTMVGLGTGTHEVDTTVELTVRFEVDDSNTVTAERFWHNEESYKPTPSGGNNDDDDNGGGGSTTTTTIPDPVVPLAAADTIEISDGAVPLSDGAVLNIEDAPIPLAVLPMTGDVSVIWMLISLISGLGLAGVSFADWKKRK